MPPVIPTLSIKIYFVIADELEKTNSFSTFLRDRKTGKTYKFGHSWYDFAPTLLDNLKDKFPATNFIGCLLYTSPSPRD